jgi:hypothetical protein
MKDFYDIAGHQGLDEGVTGREFGPQCPTLKKTFETLRVAHQATSVTR